MFASTKGMSLSPAESVLSNAKIASLSFSFHQQSTILLSVGSDVNLTNDLCATLAYTSEAHINAEKEIRI